MVTQLAASPSNSPARPNFRWRPRVYLAGKIARNDWRHELVPGLDGAYLGQPIDCGQFIFCGPYFASCGHGCAHGAETHGLADRCGTRQTAPPRWSVPSLCCYWLHQADLVFAWIDDPTCFGTLTELGWAQMLGKSVFVGFSNAQLRGQMWFVLYGPKTHHGVFDSPHTALQRALALANLHLS